MRAGAHIPWSYFGTRDKALLKGSYFTKANMGSSLRGFVDYPSNPVIYNGRLFERFPQGCERACALLDRDEGVVSIITLADVYVL